MSIRSRVTKLETDSRGSRKLSIREIEDLESRVASDQTLLRRLPDFELIQLACRSLKFMNHAELDAIKDLRDIPEIRDAWPEGWNDDAA